MVALRSTAHSRKHSPWSYSIDAGKRRKARESTEGRGHASSTFSGRGCRLGLHFGEHDERGANLVEYILLIAFIAIIVIVAVKVLGNTVSTQFSSANSNLQ